MSFVGSSFDSASKAGFISLPRSIGGIQADITVEEEGNDEVTLTDHPVELGAEITDHAYKNPARLTVHIAFSNSSDAAGGDPNYCIDQYNALLALQVSRQPITIITGQRSYTNMLITGIAKRTDETSENALFVTLTARQVILVSTQTSPVSQDTANQLAPQKTAQVQDQGTVQLAQFTAASTFQ